MEVFKEYSKYYNLLYKDKDYEREADYVISIIKKNCPNAKTILNLGCGTGKHDLFFAERGYIVTGIDMSDEMIAEAKFSASNKRDLEFQLGDIRNVRLNKKFDVVISLFHVMSYQVTNDDLYSAFLTAKEHLNVGGFLIFDFWYGPAVLTDRPETRIKKLENEEIEVTRIAESTLYPNENYVDVKYNILIKNKFSQSYKELQEVHKMRYLFLPELKLFLTQTNFQVKSSTEWLSDRALSFSTWNGIIVSQRNS